MNTEFTSSELIYLFLDGEHSAVERSVLFSSLASNAELQTEFEDAVKIRGAAIKEASSIAPSAAVTSSLMSKAGFAGSALVGATSQGWFSQLFGSWGTTMLTYVVPGLMALGGVGLGMLISRPSDSINTLNNKELTQTPILNNVQVDKLTNELKQQQNTITELTITNGKLVDRVNSLSSSIERERRNNTGLQRLSTTPNVTEASEGKNSQGINSQAGFTSNPSNINEGIIKQSFAPELKPTHFISNTTPAKLDVNSVRVTIPSIEQTLSPEKSWQESDLNISLRGISVMGFSDLQTQGLIASDNLFNNLSFAVSLAKPINEYLSLVGEVGHETFPLYEYSNDVSQTVLKQTIVWGSGGVRYLHSPITELLNIQPLLQFTLGGSPYGMVYQTNVAIGLQASSKLMFTLGATGFNLRQTNFNNESRWVNKLSLNYGVSIAF